MGKDKVYATLLKKSLVFKQMAFEIKFYFGCVCVVALKLVGLGQWSFLGDERVGIWWLFLAGLRISPFSADFDTLHRGGLEEILAVFNPCAHSILVSPLSPSAPLQWKDPGLEHRTKS